jgi:hypothetical protein
MFFFVQGMGGYAGMNGTIGWHFGMTRYLFAARTADVIQLTLIWQNNHSFRLYCLWFATFHLEN